MASTKGIGIILPSDLYNAIADRATAEQRSKGQVIRMALEQVFTGIDSSHNAESSMSSSASSENATREAA